MRTRDVKSREIIEILADVVSRCAEDCQVTVFNGQDFVTVETPCLNYVFGNSRYIKSNLDELSKSISGTAQKLPMIALICPFNEIRNDPDFYSVARVKILIACSTIRDWNNEQRLEYSFKNILRPIYRSFLKALKEDGRFDFGFKKHVRHEYSENYSYGKYGAHTSAGDAVSEPIDAININNLELKVKLPNCR